MEECVQQIYPQLPDEELEQAAANLNAYLGLAWEIFEEAQGKDAKEIPQKEKSPTKRVDSIYRTLDSSQG